MALASVSVATPPKSDPPIARPVQGGAAKSIFTLNAAPPGFDGKSRPIVHPIMGLDGWRTSVGEPCDWVLDESGVLLASDHDVVVPFEFGDVQLHIEYSLPTTPGRLGSAKASSGAVLHGRYEIELLNSFGRPASTSCCGALKGLVAPIANASLPSPGWQTLDVFFRAPRLAGEVVLEKPRVTVLLNGALVLNNVEIDRPTDASVAQDMPATGTLTLQGSPDGVKFRNLWLRHP